MKKTKKILALVACVVLCFTLAVVPCFAYADATQTKNESSAGGELSSIWDTHTDNKTVWYRSHFLGPVSTSFGATGITFHVPTAEIPLWDYWFYLADVGFQGYTSIKETFDIIDYIPNLYFQLASSVDGQHVNIGSIEADGTITYHNNGVMNTRNIFSEYSSLGTPIRLSVEIVVDPLRVESYMEIGVTTEHYVTYYFTCPLDIEVNPSHTYALRHYFWKPETPFNIQVGLRSLDIQQYKYTYTLNDIISYGQSSYSDGYAIGKDEADNDAFNKGYNTGYTEGSREAYNNGYTDGHEAGIEVGFVSRDEEVEGYKNEINILTDTNKSLEEYKNSNNALSSLSEGIFNGLSGFLKPIFDFEFLGVKVSAVVALLGTTIVAFFVLKLIRG